MMLVPCPWCGPRNVSEFAHLGEVVARPDPATTDRRQWRDYLYFRENPMGAVTETWFHRAGCRTYFTIERDTATNAVTSPSGARAPEHGQEPAEGGRT